MLQLLALLALGTPVKVSSFPAPFAGELVGDPFGNRFLLVEPRFTNRSDSGVVAIYTKEGSKLKTARNPFSNAIVGFNGKSAIYVREGRGYVGVFEPEKPFDLLVSTEDSVVLGDAVVTHGQTDTIALKIRGAQQLFVRPEGAFEEGIIDPWARKLRIIVWSEESSMRLFSYDWQTDSFTRPISVSGPSGKPIEWCNYYTSVAAGAGEKLYCFAWARSFDGSDLENVYTAPDPKPQSDVGSTPYCLVEVDAKTGVAQPLAIFPDYEDDNNHMGDSPRQIAVIENGLTLVVRHVPYRRPGSAEIYVFQLSPATERPLPPIPPPRSR